MEAAGVATRMMSFKPGDRVVVYDVSLIAGQAKGTVLERPITVPHYKIPIELDSYEDIWLVHPKQLERLSSPMFIITLKTWISRLARWV